MYEVKYRIFGCCFCFVYITTKRKDGQIVLEAQTFKLDGLAGRNHAINYNVLHVDMTVC